MWYDLNVVQSKVCAASNSLKPTAVTTCWWEVTQMSRDQTVEGHECEFTFHYCHLHLLCCWAESRHYSSRWPWCFCLHQLLQGLIHLEFYSYTNTYIHIYISQLLQTFLLQVSLPTPQTNGPPPVPPQGFYTEVTELRFRVTDSENERLQCEKQLKSTNVSVCVRVCESDWQQLFTLVPHSEFTFSRPSLPLLFIPNTSEWPSDLSCQQRLCSFLP